MNFFSKHTIQNKMLWAILPLLLLQVVIIGGVYTFFAYQQFNTRVDQYIQERENDIYTLTEKSDILEYIQNDYYDLKDEAKMYKLRLEEQFYRFFKRRKFNNKPIYKQITFIDKDGNEIAKLDVENEQIDYKNIARNKYYKQAKALSPNKVDKERIKGELYVYSPLYLDQDGDGITEYSGALITKVAYPTDDFNQSTLKSFSLTAALVLISGLIIYFLLRVVKRLIEPIKNLVKATESLSRGNLDVRASIMSQDEIGQLAVSFNKMAEDLKKNINELEEYKNELEIKVAQRTQELEQSNQDLTEAYKQLKNTQAQLVHSEKMASLGQLVAGVAHELNNPINFIYGNMPHLKNYIEDLKSILSKYEDVKIAEIDKTNINDLKEDLNWEFMLPDLDLLIKDCANGAERAKAIIQDLKNFSRLGEAEFKASDIHEGLESTLNLLNNSLKNRIDVVKEYQDFGKIDCYPEQLNQVFMNIISNAIQAMPEEKITNKQAKIWINTKKQDDNIIISIKDNANGIPEEYLKKIFDPFFTTKPVGKGTGLGLSITYGIIEKHHGSILVNSIIGEGTTFTISLPAHQKK